MKVESANDSLQTCGLEWFRFRYQSLVHLLSKLKGHVPIHQPLLMKIISNKAVGHPVG